jgi:hypothetical protein
VCGTGHFPEDPDALADHPWTPAAYNTKHWGQYWYSLHPRGIHVIIISPLLAGGHPVIQMCMYT